jgi:hypothetical protein
MGTQNKIIHYSTQVKNEVVVPANDDSRLNDDRWRHCLGNCPLERAD